MNNMDCPHCGVSFFYDESNSSEVVISLRTIYTRKISDNINDENEDYHAPNSYLFPMSKVLSGNAIRILTFICPSCRNPLFLCQAVVNNKKTDLKRFWPPFKGKDLPDYIPHPIRADYEEACAIMELSPKASATLARRCLQGMIRDFWKIQENTLYKEISALKDKVPPTQWKAIDALRALGNIGAHMEKDTDVIIDIDPEEARKLIGLIELLMDKWYISRYDEEQKYKDLIKTNEEKQALR